MLKAWLSRRAERRVLRAATARFQAGTSQADVLALFAALDILRRAGRHEAGMDNLNRFAMSTSRRYCALTQRDRHTYAVDLHEAGYLRWPDAGIKGFDAERLYLEPNTQRPDLGAWWVEPFCEDLQAPGVSWQRVGPVEMGADRP